MPIPIAYFGYSKDNLTINLNNLSLNNPTSFQWDFGDGGNSTVENPGHTYNSTGFYNVSLIATNDDGDSEQLSMIIGLGEYNDMVSKTLPELISLELPSNIIEQDSMGKILTYIQKWQVFLQPMVIEPNILAVEDTHNEFKWPGLVNLLIAKLVSYDFIISNASKYATNPAGSNNNVDDNSNKKNIKSIETGPAKTEWFDENNSESAMQLGKAYSAITIPGGLLDQIKQSACQLASRNNIYLSMCDNSRNHIKPITVGCK